MLVHVGSAWVQMWNAGKREGVHGYIGQFLAFLLGFFSKLKKLELLGIVVKG